ncbi:MAG: DNA-binding response regulator [Bacteroidetes bacterium HGW-Bacteroidetes-11]|jgi:two-component system LytT family response regulator|nr:MAG: DNA-binding response regulator [Bacteroidetes bacterium HGW-Bacteroidetes-11]
MTKAVIIDDEFRSRETLREMLKLYCSDVEVVAEGEDVKSGVKAIKTHNPDLVFLDIKMPDGSGFDLLRQLLPIDFKLIFITAYEEYAIKAFKFNAIDYITKPVDPDELKSAVSKVSKFINSDNLNDHLKQMLNDYIKPMRAENKKVILKTAEAIHVIDTDDIVRCESNSNYTMFYINDGDKIIVSKSIKEFVEFLEERNFFRVHHSHLINLNFLKRFKKDELFCVLKDNTEVPVSFRKRNELLKMLKTL